MYVIRYSDLKNAIEPARKKVKVSEPNLWKEAWSEGIEDWQQGFEIRSEAIAVSLFTTGTKELLHCHEKIWEIYQVIEGSLRIAVKPFRKSTWSAVVLNSHDMLMLTPGTLHLVDSESEHISLVIQAPPAYRDQVVIENKEEIEAAYEALREAHV